MFSDIAKFHELKQSLQKTQQRACRPATCACVRGAVRWPALPSVVVARAPVPAPRVISRQANRGRAPAGVLRAARCTRARGGNWGCLRLGSSPGDAAAVRSARLTLRLLSLRARTPLACSTVDDTTSTTTVTITYPATTYTVARHAPPLAPAPPRGAVSVGCARLNLPLEPATARDARCVAGRRPHRHRARVLQHPRLLLRHLGKHFPALCGGFLYLPFFAAFRDRWAAALDWRWASPLAQWEAGQSCQFSRSRRARGVRTKSGCRVIAHRLRSSVVAADYSTHEGREHGAWLLRRHNVSFLGRPRHNV